MKWLWLACWLLGSIGTYGQSPDSTANPLTVSGYVEAYYVQDLTAPATAQERPAFLYNHKRNREVNLNLAYIKVAYTSEWLRANGAFQVGTYAQYNLAAEPSLIKNIYEATAGVKLSRHRNVWLDAGVFGSHIGWESAVSKDCWTLTRSIVAENSPYYLAGVKVTYNTPDNRWTLLGSVVNGWQHVAKLPGSGRLGFSSQVQFRPSDKLTLNWSTFLGTDRPDSLRQERFYNDFYATYSPTAALGFLLGFDIGLDRKPQQNGRRIGAGAYVWYTPTLIARYAVGRQGFLAGRVEYFADPDAVIITLGNPNGFRTMGYSLNYDYALHRQALWRLEAKLYQSQAAIFEARSGWQRTNLSLATSLAVWF